MFLNNMPINELVTIYLCDNRDTVYTLNWNNLVYWNDIQEQMQFQLGTLPVNTSTNSAFVLACVID